MSVGSAGLMKEDYPLVRVAGMESFQQSFNCQAWCSSPNR